MERFTQDITTSRVFQIAAIIHKKQTYKLESNFAVVQPFSSDQSDKK